MSKQRHSIWACLILESTVQNFNLIKKIWMNEWVNEWMILYRTQDTGIFIHTQKWHLVIKHKSQLQSGVCALLFKVWCSHSRNAGSNQNLEMIQGAEVDQRIHLGKPDTNTHCWFLSHVTTGISLVFGTQIPSWPWTWLNNGFSLSCSWCNSPYLSPVPLSSDGGNGTV